MSIPFEKWKDQADQIVTTCQRLYARNLLAACDGNVSIRRDDGTVLITPSARPKAFFNAKEMSGIDLDGRTLWGSPSAEKQMHLEIYRRCPEAKAVVHAHPPYGISWTLIDPPLEELPFESLPEVLLAVGRIPIAPYARPTTEDMGLQLRKFLPEQKVILLQRHGAVCWGGDIEEAYMGMERLEHSAQILWQAQTLGPLSRLPAEELNALLDMRKKMGNKNL